MAFTREEVVRVMRHTGIVPLFTHDNASDAWDVIRAAYQGGVRAFEFTNRKANAFEVFQELVARRGELPDLMLGGGYHYGCRDNGEVH